MGGLNQGTKKVNSASHSMEFFRTTYVTFLTHSFTRIFIIASFVVYLSISLYGTTHLKGQFIPRQFFRYDSWMHEYDLIEDKYVIGGYPYRYQILITSPVDYSNTTVQANVKNLLEKCTAVNFITSEFAENWLESFLKWAVVYKEFEDIDISTKEGFIDALRNHYLSPTSPMSTDIVFNENYTEIIASRFILQVKGLSNKADDMVLVLNDLREISRAEDTLDMSLYIFWNAYIDPMTTIFGLSVQLITWASILVLIISAIFIPSVAVIVCVFCTIVSTLLGIVGLMTIWGVSLDPACLICLVMSIGLTVDFSAHVSFSFVSSKSENTVDKLRNTLQATGLPVIQGAFSTIVVVAPLFIYPSYTLNMVAKIFFLVVCLSLYHALVILPTVLSLCHGFSTFFSNSKKGAYVVNYS